ncbi:hypothetical protein ACFVJ8_18360 [Streptomyces yangpuensis]|uniref:hypothetical protein n=1 Tax=Streptomyces yangpuensis TaxID=1648182 RepID=UPI0036457E3E
MPHLDRRGFLAASAVAGIAGPLTATATDAAAAAAHGPAGPKILPADPRYPSLQTGINRRYVARPEHVRMVRSAHLAALLRGTGLTPRPVERPSGELAAMPNLLAPRELPWLDAARMVGAPNPVWANPLARVGLKSAYHRRNFTEHQLKAAYRHLSRTDNPDTSMVLLSFGGAINAHREEDTAAAQRDSVFKVLYQVIWSDAQDDAKETDRLRAFYGDVHAETGGGSR